MRNQNNLRNKKQNVLFARGKIIEVNNEASNPYFTLFIRNGGGRKHTFLKCYFKLEKFQLQKGMTALISGHIENINTKNSYKIIQYESILKKNADFKRFFFLSNAVYCIIFQFKLYLLLYLFS